MAKKEKTVRFYRVMALTPRQGERAVEQVDWWTLLGQWGQRPLADQVVGPDKILFHPDATAAAPAVGAHSSASAAFQSRISMTSATVEDVLSLEEDGDMIANSTAIAFLLRHNVFALVQGNASSPRQNVVRVFLDEVKPFSAGEKWVIRPIIDPAHLRRFRDETDGVKWYQGVISTKRDLLTPNAEGFMSALDRIAEQVGADLKVEIKISLDDAAVQSKASRRSLRSYIVKSLDRIVQGSKKSLVHATNEDGTVEETLSLIQEKFTATASISDDVTGSARFTELVREVVRVAGEEDNRIKKIMEG